MAKIDEIKEHIGVLNKYKKLKDVEIEEIEVSGDNYNFFIFYFNDSSICLIKFFKSSIEFKNE